MEELMKEKISLEEELNTLKNDSVSKKKSENIAYQIMQTNSLFSTHAHIHT